MEAHTIDRAVDLLAWVELQGEPLVALKERTFGAVILQGHPVHGMSDAPGTGGGYTLYWHDYVVNEWGEWFPDFPTALARLAVLQQAVETQTFFARDPAEFVPLAEYLFERTFTPKEGFNG